MGILNLADGAFVGCAGWALRAILVEIALVLGETGHTDLAAWLTSDDSPAQLYAYLDAQDLTEGNRQAFLAAIGPAYRRSAERGPAGWSDPAFWDGYIELFSGLAAQAEGLAQAHRPER